MQLSFFWWETTPVRNGNWCGRWVSRSAIAKLTPELMGDLPPWDYKSLKKSTEMYRHMDLHDAAWKLIILIETASNLDSTGE